MGATPCCGAPALERTGLIAPWLVESSWTRDWTHVPCIGRQILNHWTTREALTQLSELFRHDQIISRTGYHAVAPSLPIGCSSWTNFTAASWGCTHWLSCGTYAFTSASAFWGNRLAQAFGKNYLSAPQLPHSIHINYKNSTCLIGLNIKQISTCHAVSGGPVCIIDVISLSLLFILRATGSQ